YRGRRWKVLWCYNGGKESARKVSDGLLQLTEDGTADFAAADHGTFCAGGVVDAAAGRGGLGDVLAGRGAGGEGGGWLGRGRGGGEGTGWCMRRNRTWIRRCWRRCWSICRRLGW